MKFPGEIFINDIDGSSVNEEVPANSYYCKSEASYFLAKDFDQRIMLPRASWTVIPNEVPITRNFIQHSIWYDSESAEIALAQAKEEYAGEYIRAVVDTIPYDPWKKLLEELNLIYGKFVALCADENGQFDLPPYGDDGRNR